MAKKLPRFNNGKTAPDPKKKIVKKYTYYDADGVRRGKTFTAYSTAELAQKISDWNNSVDTKISRTMTVEKSINTYISAKEAILSPTTIRSYKSIQKNHFDDIGKIAIKDLSTTRVQKWISDLSASGASPKTVQNCFALFRSSLLMYDKRLDYNVQLPMLRPYTNYCPSDEDIEKLITRIKEKNDKPLLIGTLLIAFGPLREGEACALTSDDVHGNIISINKSMAYTEDNTWIIKEPKTPSSIRDLEYPDFVIDMIKDIKGRLVPLTPHAFYDRFRRIMKDIDIPYFRVHDIRHYGTSIMHAMNVPDLYILKRGGWSSDYVMKKVYRNVIDDEQKKQTDIIINHFKKFS